jgi:hypothetical protein
MFKVSPLIDSFVSAGMCFCSCSGGILLWTPFNGLSCRFPMSVSSVESSLVGTTAVFVACMMTEISSNFIASSVAYAGDESYVFQKV